jgi:hypothetical protein
MAWSWKSLKPQDNRQNHLASHTLVPHKAHRMRPVRRVHIAAQHALDMTSCLAKIPGLTQYGPDHAIGDQPISRVRLFRS